MRDLYILLKKEISLEELQAFPLFSGISNILWVFDGNYVDSIESLVNGANDDCINHMINDFGRGNLSHLAGAGEGKNKVTIDGKRQFIKDMLKGLCNSLGGDVQLTILLFRLLSQASNDTAYIDSDGKLHLFSAFIFQCLIPACMLTLSHFFNGNSVSSQATSLDVHVRYHMEGKELYLSYEDGKYTGTIQDDESGGQTGGEKKGETSVVLSVQRVGKGWLSILRKFSFVFRDVDYNNASEDGYCAELISQCYGALFFCVLTDTVLKINNVSYDLPQDFNNALPQSQADRQSWMRVMSNLDHESNKALISVMSGLDPESNKALINVIMGLSPVHNERLIKMMLKVVAVQNGAGNLASILTRFDTVTARMVLLDILPRLGQKKLLGFITGLSLVLRSTAPVENFEQSFDRYIPAYGSTYLKGLWSEFSGWVEKPYAWRGNSLSPLEEADEVKMGLIFSRYGEKTLKAVKKLVKTKLPEEQAKKGFERLTKIFVEDGNNTRTFRYEIAEVLSAGDFETNRNLLLVLGAIPNEQNIPRNLAELIQNNSEDVKNLLRSRLRFCGVGKKKREDVVLLLSSAPASAAAASAQLTKVQQRFIAMLLLTDKESAKVVAEAAMRYREKFIQLIASINLPYFDGRWVNVFIRMLEDKPKQVEADTILTGWITLAQNGLISKKVVYGNRSTPLRDLVWACGSKAQSFADVLVSFQKVPRLEFTSELVNVVYDLHRNGMVSGAAVLRIDGIWRRYGELFSAENETTTIERTVFFVSLLPRNVDERNKICDVLKQATELYQSFVFSIDDGRKIPLDNLVRRLGEMKDGRLGQLSSMEFWTGLPALFYADADPIRSRDGFTQRSYDCAQSFLNYISNPEDSAQDVVTVINFLKKYPKCWHKDTFQGLQNYRAADVATEIRRRTEPDFKAGLKNWLGRHFFSRWTTAGRVERLVADVMKSSEIDFNKLSQVYSQLILPEGFAVQQLSASDIANIKSKIMHTIVAHGSVVGNTVVVAQQLFQLAVRSAESVATGPTPSQRRNVSESAITDFVGVVAGSAIAAAASAAEAGAGAEAGAAAQPKSQEETTAVFETAIVNFIVAVANKVGSKDEFIQVLNALQEQLILRQSLQEKIALLNKGIAVDMSLDFTYVECFIAFVSKEKVSADTVPSSPALEAAQVDAKNNDEKPFRPLGPSG